MRLCYRKGLRLYVLKFQLITDRLSKEEAELLDRLLDKCVNG